MLRNQETSPDEIKRLLGLVERDLRQADASGLELDGVFGFLYNAALQLTTIAIRLRHLRVRQAGFHRETFRLGSDLVPDRLKPAILSFERARRKRHALTYDQAGVVTNADVESLRASIVVVEIWVRQEAAMYLASEE
ncbi:hypothetical protein JW848_10305 [Candidatus Bipolaricaulota bacterium]|nr:hypothetical protein [Candidatus Bipolaricaulota bacterium]